MGRLPKPTALRVLEGNREHRPLPAGEIKPRPSLPACPRWLTGHARNFWRRTAPRVHRYGLLTELDIEMFTNCCVMYGRWRQAEEDVQRYLEATGRLPRLRVVTATRYLDRFNQLAAHFGLSPVARLRLAGREADVDDSLGILS